MWHEFLANLVSGPEPSVRPDGTYWRVVSTQLISDWPGSCSAMPLPLVCLVVDGSMGRDGRPEDHRSGDRLFDRELDHLPAEVRWREWMHRVEATIFAASEPISRETLARIVGKSCNLDLIIDDIREELRGRPYDLVAIARLVRVHKGWFF